MAHAPSWRPEGQDEIIGLGVASAGKSIPRPLPGRVMAGLAGAILAALGVAGYAASDFLDVDPTETASVAHRLAIPPVAAKTTSTSESAASSDKIEIAAAAQTMPAAKSERVATLQDRPVAVAPTSSDRAPIDNVSNNLPKDTTPETMSPVFAPPRDAQHVAELTPDVAVAESEAEVVKLEGQIGMGEPPPESEMEIARLERAAAPSDALMPIAEDTAAMGGPYIPASEFEATRVTRYVNLRDGPADEAKVIAVIPTNSTVQAETNCGWCAVTYKGQRGYIYKGFLSGRGGGGAKAIGGRTRVTKKLSGKPGLY